MDVRDGTVGDPGSGALQTNVRTFLEISPPLLLRFASNGGPIVLAQIENEYGNYSPPRIA
jgi:hypothetical protein